MVGNNNDESTQAIANSDNLVSWRCDKRTFVNNSIDNMFECKMCQNKRNTNDLNKINTLVEYCIVGII